jgi:hypothetical protein
MKKQILIVVVLCILTSTFITNVYAQSSSSSTLGTGITNYMEVSFLFGSPVSIAPGYGNINAINAKAVRNFYRDFKEASDEKWYKVSNGYIARFVSQGNESMAAYNTKGKWMFTINYYDENKLPDEIKGIVKGTFYDYSITRVEEIHTEDKTIYMIHMQDESTWKNVRVCDGEMEIAENFNKK